MGTMVMYEVGVSETEEGEIEIHQGRFEEPDAVIVISKDQVPLLIKWLSELTK